jgi:hypothetical protein
VVKIEIEIPDPPEGFVIDGFRQAEPGERWWDAVAWSECVRVRTTGAYLVAVKAKPPWEPSPELIAVLRPGWLTRNENTSLVLHSDKPLRKSRVWESEGNHHYLHCVRPELLPPTSIPWDQFCFKIGEPKE